MHQNLCESLQGQSVPLKIAVITWNLHGRIPQQKYRESLFSMFQQQVQFQQSDFIAVYTQQCQRPLIYSMCYENKQAWEQQLCNTKPLKTKYLMITSLTMCGLHTIIFKNKNYAGQIKINEESKLRAGYWNIFGNKGAIKIVLGIQNKNLCFINCHLPPNQNGNQERNNVLMRIEEQFVPKFGKNRIILGGDLNYRIDMSQKEYNEIVGSQEKNTQQNFRYTEMISNDQLTNQPQLKKKFLGTFVEGQINFPPTYRLQIQSNQYTPQRIPGWTDRIFRREADFKLKKYCCRYDVLGSDHRPVIALFQTL